MLNLGLTGGIGCGKSTVAGMFAAMGARVMDSDAIVRDLLGPGGEAAQELVGVFGSDVLRADGSADREALAARVFGDDAARKKLEGILHPKVIAIRRERIRAFEKEGGPGTVTLSEAALIFEVDTWREFDGIVLVTAPSEIKRSRLMAAGWALGEIERRMAAQWPDEKKVALADWIVDNGGDESHTRAQVETLWRRFQVMARAREEDLVIRGLGD